VEILVLEHIFDSDL